MYSKEKFLENTIMRSTTVSSENEGVYVADFETSKIHKDKTDTFVYATGLMDVYDEKDLCLHTNNIEDFITSISNLPHIESKIYFHNLSFDTIFCLLNLVEKGFEQIRNKYKERHDGGLKFINGKKTIEVTKETVRPKKKDDEKYLKRPFSYNVIYNNGSFYRVDLYFDFVTYTDKKKKKKHKLRTVSLMDSYKMVSSPLKKIAKDFLNYEMAKDGIDHSIIRPKNYNLKPKEQEYLYEDVKILKDFIKLTTIEGIEVNEYYKVFFNKMTTASQALNEYKTLLEHMYEDESYKEVKAFKEGFESIEKYALQQEEKGRKFNVNKDMLFKGVFPTLHPNIDCWLRQSYYGGITWKNEDLVSILVSPIRGKVYDVNSLYPYAMRNKLLPYGEPLFYEGCYNNIASFVKKDYPLYVQKIRVRRFNLKPGKMPNIQIRDSNNFRATEYQKSNEYYCEYSKKFKYEECVFTFTNVQLERFLDSYDLPMGIEYIEGYAFKGSYGIFDKYVDTFMYLKENSEGARRALAKLLQNALYGKFGTNPQREERIIEFIDGVFSTTNRDEQGNLLEYLSDSVYLPIASFITAYARDVLIEAVNALGVGTENDRFLYADTDSIHIIGDEIPNIEIHKSKLGAWKHEGDFTDAVYIGAKRYAELIDGKWDIKCCGVSSDIIDSLDDINVFKPCEYSPKDLKKKIDSFYKKDDIYYYKDKECTIRVKGLLRSKKKLYVKGGVLIQEQPYAITTNTFVFGR